MEYNYLIILDYSSSRLITIELSKEERDESENYEDFEEYLCTLEEKYGFKLSDVNWMVAESLKVINYKNGKEVSYAKLGECCI